MTNFEKWKEKLTVEVLNHLGTNSAAFCTICPARRMCVEFTA